MDPALRQTYALWVFSIGLVALMIVGGVAAVRRGEPAGPTAVMVVLVLLGIVMYRTRRAQSALFLAPTSEPALAFYRRKIRDSVPNGDLLRAHASAVTCACYGEFDRAEQFLNSVEWFGRGAIHEAMPLYVRALMAYWRDGYVERGRSLATRAAEMARMPRLLPGASSTRLAYDVLVAAGDALAGAASPEAVAILEKGRRKLPLHGGMIATWGLAVARERAGLRADVESLLSANRRVAPYCRPLLTIPLAASGVVDVPAMPMDVAVVATPAVAVVHLNPARRAAAAFALVTGLWGALLLLAFGYSGSYMACALVTGPTVAAFVGFKYLTRQRKGVSIRAVYAGAVLGMAIGSAIAHRLAWDVTGAADGSSDPSGAYWVAIVFLTSVASSLAANHLVTTIWSHSPQRQ